MSRPRRTLSMNSIKHSITRPCKINKKRTSTLMLRNVSKNGKVRARMSSQSYWSSKTTRRKLCDQQIEKESKSGKFIIRYTIITIRIIMDKFNELNCKTYLKLTFILCFHSFTIVLIPFDKFKIMTYLKAWLLEL